MYYACLLLDDNTASDVDYGGSHSESAAARIALRVSNAEKCDTCVVKRTAKGDSITQRVRWKNHEAVAETPVHLPPLPKSEYLTVNLSSDEGKFVDFVFRRVAMGYTVVVSPSRQGHPVVNVTSSTHN